MLLPFLGHKTTSQAAEEVLDVVVIKGNAKEVFLKCIEGLQNTTYDRELISDDVDENQTAPTEEVDPVLQTTKLYQAAQKG
jgi:fatty acid/phospholipid biosynthesis enzyme